MQFGGVVVDAKGRTLGERVWLEYACCRLNGQEMVNERPHPTL